MEIKADNKVDTIDMAAERRDTVATQQQASQETPIQYEKNLA